MPVKARRAELCVVCSFWATDPMCSHGLWRPHRGAEERGRKKSERKPYWEPPALPLTQDCCRMNSPCRDKLCKDHCPGTIAGPTSHMPSPRKPQQISWLGVPAVVRQDGQMGQELGWELAPTPGSRAAAAQPISASNLCKHVTCPQQIHAPQEAFDWHSGTASSEQPKL